MVQIALPCRLPVSDHDRRLADKINILIGESVAIDGFRNEDLSRIAGIEYYNLVMERIIAANSQKLFELQQMIVTSRANGVCPFKSERPLDKAFNKEIAETYLKRYFEKRHNVCLLGVIIENMSDPFYEPFAIPMTGIDGKGYWNECDIAVGKISFNLSGYCFYRK